MSISERGRSTNGATEGRVSRIEEERKTQEFTLLIVEDEDPLRQAVSKILRKHGFSVIEARDGSAALEAMHAHKSDIDVLFMDITLPGAPSREVFAEAKRLRPRMRIIVTSAYSEDLATKALGERSDRFIRKPYLITDLIDLFGQTHS
jgi:CheY-like chemotaxis protein